MEKAEQGKYRKLTIDESIEALRYLLDDVRIIQQNIIFVLGLPKSLMKPKII